MPEGFVVMTKLIVVAALVSLSAFTLAADRVDVSSMENQILTDDQIKAVLTDRSLYFLNSRGQEMEYFFRAGGYLIGTKKSDNKGDTGQWTVKEGVLCTTWKGWTDSCDPVSVENGKLKLGEKRQN